VTPNKVRLRAKRRAGDLLREMKELGERTNQGQPRKETSNGTTLPSDIGITHDQSSRWQKLDAVPEEKAGPRVA
jgi:hypothetical protein